jgi:phosphate butyryltransferase
MVLASLDRFIELARQKGIKKLVIAVAQDEDVLKAAGLARTNGLITPVLVGNEAAIRQASEKAGFAMEGIDVFHEPDNAAACALAVRLIREGKADILMKGMVATGILVKAMLDKEGGLLKGGLLSHLAFFETPYYPKLLCITDAALNIAPDINDKVSIVVNAVNAYHSLGINEPRVAILAPVETVNPKMEATVHGAMLTQMQRRKQIKGCLVDGPLALDNAISAEAAHHKGLNSEVAGQADILVAPDLNAGNALYKSLNFLGGAVSAAVVAGAAVPVVLTSRADDEKSKYLSIALAVAMA